MLIRPAALALALLLQPAVAAPQGVDPAALAKEGHKLWQAGQLDEALARYERALAANPDFAEAQIGAGIILDLKGDYAGARRHLARALEKSTPDARGEALAAMAVSYAFDRKARQASVYYDQLFDRQVADGNLEAAAETANALGRVYLESGQTAPALKWYRTGFETVRRQRKVPGPRLDLAEMRWLHAQARIAARRGLFAEARRDLAALKALIDKGGPNAEQMPIYWYLMGYIDFHAGQYDSAVRALANADQGDPFILLLMGEANERKGRTKEAAEIYGRILSITSHTLQNALARPIARQKLQVVGQKRNPPRP